MSRLARRLALLLPVLLCTACGFTEPVAEAAPDTLSRAQFISVYVELRNAERRMLTAEEFAAAKQEILDRHDATPEALLDFVRAHGDDVDYMAAVWDSIQVRIDAVGRDSAAT